MASKLVNIYFCAKHFVDFLCNVKKGSFCPLCAALLLVNCDPGLGWFDGYATIKDIDKRDDGEEPSSALRAELQGFQQAFFDM